MISVALCTYNGQDYIEAQLLSIIQQDMSVDEIIVSDDCSCDDTIKIVKNIADKYPQISWSIVEHTRNIGVVKNFEEAISTCSGDIIFTADQDDIWLPYKVRTISSFFEQCPTISVVFTDAILIKDDGKRLSEHTLWEAICFSPFIPLWEAGCGFEMFNFHNMATGATMAIRKSFYDKIPPFLCNKHIIHDYQLALAGILSDAISIIPQPLIKYRIHQHNTIGVQKDNWIFQQDSQSPLTDVALYTEPYPINPYVRYYCEQMKIKPPYIYTQRIAKYATIGGKLWLLLHFTEYKKRYKQFWRSFFSSDILYGIIKR